MGTLENSRSSSPGEAPSLGFTPTSNRDNEHGKQDYPYIHYNPVKHGWVDQVKDWPHSSFHKWVERGDLPVSWGAVAAPVGDFGE